VTSTHAAPAPAPAPGIAARSAALRILRAVRSGTTFDAALDAALAGLEDHDRRLAHEIAAGVLRSRTTLDAAITPHVHARWSRVAEDVRDILRVGAYQLTALERVPAYAAVQSAVDLARETHGAKTAGFANAVLRRVAERARAPAARAAQGGAPMDARALAKEYSHPEWLVARWLEHYGPDRTEALLRHDNTRPTLTVRPLAWEKSRIRDSFEAAGITVEDGPEPDVLIARGARRIEDLPGFLDGGFIVQDAAQALVLAHARVPDGAIVWDACAAPGGKAAVLAQRCRVVASDGSRPRTWRLTQTLERTAPSVRVAVADASYPPLAERSVDIALVDAPCSATGTIAKHPDARWRLKPAAIADLAERQRAILDGAAATVRPGGALIYITCSLEPEENEDQVESFLERHPDFARDGADLAVFPTDRGTDGAFAARLVRAQ